MYIIAYITPYIRRYIHPYIWALYTVVLLHRQEPS